MTPEGVLPGIDDGKQTRLGLQRGSGRNLSRHVRRTAVRAAVLVAADLAVFWVMRALIRAVRDDAALGTAASETLTRLLPRGYMNGWQFGAALLVGLLFTGNYGTGDARRDAGRLFRGCALAAGLPLWMSIWNLDVGTVLVWFLTATSLVWLAILAERLMVDQVVEYVRPPERGAPRTVFLGAAEKCRTVAALPLFASGKTYHVVGFLDVAVLPAADALGSVRDLARVVQQGRVESVVLCGQFEDDEFQRVADTALAAGCQLVSIPRTPTVGGLDPVFIWRGGEPLVTLNAPALKAQQLLVKRAVDIVGSLVGLVLLSPLFLVVAVLVKLDSRGPAFFRQPRVGFGGRIFGIIKFRTMQADADSLKEGLSHESIYGDPRLFKIKKDPRLTRFGAWLRRTSIDELPQLWNVLKGEMSLVGPRPPIVTEVAFYESRHYARFDVKPGITGPWQVSGRNDVLDFEAIMLLETAYVRRWSIWEDFGILLRTIPAVIRMRGAL